MPIKGLFPLKYSDLLDDEIWDFITQTASFYPEDAGNYPIEQQRDFYNQMCKSFFHGYPDGVVSQDKIIESKDYKLPIREYKSDATPKAHIIYFHGGGFVLGDLESHDDVCAELCSQTGFSVTSVDYRLAPEHRWPSDFQDALSSFHYARQTHNLPIVLMGDSAGGTIASSVCHSLRGESTQPIGQVLIYPALGGEFTQGSFTEHSQAPILSRSQINFYKVMRTGTDKSAVKDTGSLPPDFFVPECLPLSDTDFTNLPPTVLISADCDPLRDDSLDYHQKILGAGGKSHYINESGLIHGFLRARHCSSRAKSSFTHIVSSASMLGQGNWNF